MKSQFERYVNLIRKSAHYYSDKWNIEYDEVEAQGFLIYCESFENYDMTKSSFSTHLTWELKRLNDFCRSYKRQKGELLEDYFSNNISNFNVGNFLIDSHQVLDLYTILQHAKKYLSKKAYDVFEWILSWDWKKKNVLKPSVNLAMKEFGMNRKDTLLLWEEIKEYYTQNLLVNFKRYIYGYIRW